MLFLTVVTINKQDKISLKDYSTARTIGYDKDET